MTRRDLTGPASAYRDSKRRVARREMEWRPGLTRLHNPDPAESDALDREAERFAQRRRDERFAAMADYHAGVLPAWRPRPTLRERLARLWRKITGRG